jgi:hypothetical protein
MCRAHCERVERLIFGVMSNPSLLSKPDGVPKEPEPEIEHSPPRVTNLLLIDLRQEPGAHVVRDLRGQILLQKSLDLRGINFRNSLN